MKEKRKYEYPYSAISIRVIVALRFRAFSKKIAKSHTDTLVLVMDFFEWHGFYPTDRFEKRILDEILKNRKRTEANIAILRDIEKTQTKPVSVQMDLLFEGQTKQRESPKLVEKKFANSKKKKSKKEDTSVPKVKYQRVKTELSELKEEFSFVLGKVSSVKNNFGKDYLKLELSLSEFKRISAALKKE